MRTKGAEIAWAGQVSQHALELITELTGLNPAKARRIAITIQTHINDTAVRIHKRARSVNRPTAPIPATFSLYERETQLDALDLLLTGQETLHEYRQSHVMRRKNTVQKRLKARGEGVDHLPLVGTQTRTYAAGNCLHATIQHYNLDDNTCVIQPHDSQLTLTTTIAKASRSAVRKNNLTDCG